MFPTVSHPVHVCRRYQRLSYRSTATAEIRIKLYSSTALGTASFRASGLGPLPANRRVWSPLEDEAIRTLVEKHGTSNWTFIADSLLALECNTPGRSGKQCWERWHNHLGETHLSADSSIYYYNIRVCLDTMGSGFCMSCMCSKSCAVPHTCIRTISIRWRLLGYGI